MSESELLRKSAGLSLAVTNAVDRFAAGTELPAQYWTSGVGAQAAVDNENSKKKRRNEI